MANLWHCYFIISLHRPSYPHSVCEGPKLSHILNNQLCIKGVSGSGGESSDWGILESAIGGVIGSGSDSNDWGVSTLLLCLFSESSEKMQEFRLIKIHGRSQSAWKINIL